MLDAHRLIALRGLAGARQAAGTKFERVCIEAAAAMREHEGGRAEGLFGGLICACLPYRRLTTGAGEVTVFRRRTGTANFRLETAFDSNGLPYGIPFGAKARMNLIWLQDAAVRCASPLIAVDPEIASVHGWVRQFAVSSGGQTYRSVLEQAQRLGTCRIAITAPDAGTETEGAPMVEAISQGEGMIDTRSLPVGLSADRLIARRILLNQTFFDHLVADPVRLSLPGLLLINDNSQAIDLYAWLAHHLPRVERPVVLSWPRLASGLGMAAATQAEARRGLLRVLPLVLAIYPQARVETRTDAVTLFPSPPPL